MTRVIPGYSQPSWYSVLVNDGVVTLEGPETVPIRCDIVRRARHVQGVVAVRDRLVYPVPPVPSSAGPTSEALTSEALLLMLDFLSPCF